MASNVSRWEDAQAVLAAIVASSDDAIIGKSLDGNIVSWNQGAERIYGYTQEEMIGKNISVLAPPDRIDEMPRILETVRHGGYVRHYETERLTKDGRRLIVSLTVSPIRDKSGTVVGASTVARDVTERKQAEEEIRRLNAELEQRVVERTAQLQETIRELEAFSYSVSHDLRAPLRAIDGFSNTLLKNYQDKLDERGQDYLRRVRNAAQRMARLIDDILNLSRASRVEMHRERVDMSAMASGILNELRKSEPTRKAEIIVAPGLTVDADAHLLHIALDNLLGNAWKFTARRPIACVEVGTAQESGVRVYYVKDNGAGFDPSYAERLFSPFQRLHAERDFPGTGIGLALVRRIVRRHGGHIWAESAPDQGATFYFTLGETDR